MNSEGLSRSGAKQMLAAAIIITAATFGPTIIAATRPDHQWFMALNGLSALLAEIAGLLLIVLYLVGFLRYSASKGYSKWLGFWLFLGNIPGFIVLLLLPDLKSNTKMSTQTTGNPSAATG